MKLKKKKDKGIAKPIPMDQLLSTGSTELNLACSGRASGGLRKGRPYLFAGDTSSGKTWLAMSVLAEATINPEFDDYDLYMDAAENGVLMDVQHYFGEALSERLLPPNGTKEEPIYSSIQEEYYDRLVELLKEAKKAGRGIIYVIDSTDALRPRAQARQEAKEKKASDTGEKASGSYNVDRAKINSARLREVNTLLAETKSILIMICQSRQTIGFGAKFNPKTFSGGDALRFYPRIIIWTSIRNRIKKKVRGMNRTIGQITTVKVAKNHLCGWEGYITVPYLRGIGIDDIGACIDFLVVNKYWKKSSGNIDAKDFDRKAKKDSLIAFIEQTDNESSLRKIVARVWYDIESETIVKRKNRYRRD